MSVVYEKQHPKGILGNQGKPPEKQIFLKNFKKCFFSKLSNSF